MAVAGSSQQYETLMWTTSFLHARQVKVRAVPLKVTLRPRCQVPQRSVLSAPGLSRYFKSDLPLNDDFRLLDPWPSMQQNSWAHPSLTVGKGPCFGEWAWETSHPQRVYSRTEATEDPLA